MFDTAILGKGMKFAMKRCMDESGRIVLPKDIRKHYGINAGDELEFIATEEGILLKISSSKKETEDTPTET